MVDINELISLIGETQLYFKQQAQRQVCRLLWRVGVRLCMKRTSGH